MNNEDITMSNSERKEPLKPLEILKVGKSEVLAKVAKEVPVEEIGSQEIQELIDRMIITLREVEGVGLAAPQVEQSIRLFIVESRKTPTHPDAEEIPLMVFINPTITYSSEDIEEDTEGCLSVPKISGEVPRHTKIGIKAYDRSGKEFNIEVEGYLARVIQHENDHLDGVVFLERIEGIAPGLSKHLEFKQQLSDKD
jgi:peptide deformylase